MDFRKHFSGLLFLSLAIHFFVPVLSFFFVLILGDNFFDGSISFSIFVGKYFGVVRNSFNCKFFSYSRVFVISATVLTTHAFFVAMVVKNWRKIFEIGSDCDLPSYEKFISLVRVFVYFLFGVFLYKYTFDYIGDKSVENYFNVLCMPIGRVFFLWSIQSIVSMIAVYICLITPISVVFSFLKK